jgi:hypothetical protein
MSNDAKLFKLALAGKIDDLLDAIGGDDAGGGGAGGDNDEDYGDDEGGGSAETDEAMYKWLLVAADFGNENALEMAGDLLETSTLRYDDGGMVAGLIHLELGQHYLCGVAPIPVDHEKASGHLAQARKLEVHRTTDVGKSFDAFRRKLGVDALALFDSFFGGKKRKSAPKKKATPKKKVAAKKMATLKKRAASKKKSAPKKKKSAPTKKKAARKK